MEFVNQGLLKVYSESIQAFSEANESFNSCVICIEDVLDVYFAIVDFCLENGGGVDDVEHIGWIDKASLFSAVAMQLVDFSGKLEWKTDYEKCSALFYGLIRNRPFHDCNKRTALLTALYYLSKLERDSISNHRELEILTLIIESNTIRDRKAFEEYSKFEDGEIRFLSKYFSENTRPAGNRRYIITYIELSKQLRGFGFCLDNPRGSSIELVREENRAPLLGILKNRKKRVKVGVIRFPGWTREVPDKEMGLVRQYTGLTDKNGLHHHVVYRGEPPLSSLINQYRDIMERLSKK